MIYVTGDTHGDFKRVEFSVGKKRQPQMIS